MNAGTGIAYHNVTIYIADEAGIRHLKKSNHRSLQLPANKNWHFRYLANMLVKYLLLG
jgi:hypothetical protein